MTVILPILYSSIIIGLTFDLRSFRKGHYEVYDEFFRKTTFEDSEEYTSEYQVIDSSQNMREAFNVDARLALSMKLDYFGTNLAYLIKNSVTSRDTIVEILIRVRFQKGIEEIPENIKPSDAWKSRNYEDLGSHFVKRIIRGGELVTTIIFPCKSIEQKQKVHKSIINEFDRSGTFDKNFIEKIKTVKEKLGDDFPGFKFGSVNCLGCPPQLISSLDDIVKLAENLPKLISKTGNGNGFPLEMELQDISTISDFPKYEENKKVIAILDEIEALFDDVIIARNNFIDWKLVWSLKLTTEEDKKVHEFYNAVENARRELLHAVINLNISLSSNVDQFDAAYKVYGSTKDYNRFQRWFRDLRNEIEKKIS